MNFSLGELQTSILNAIERLMAVFDDDYWLVITTQKAYQGWKLGIPEATIMMQKIAYGIVHQADSY